MLIEEKTMKSERIYDGKILNLRVDTVELPNKKYSKREVVEYSGAVGIVAINDKNEIVLVKQYRKPIEKFLLEIPAGKLEINEEPRETALRELKEETGYTTNNLEYLLEFYPSPGMATSKIHIFLARDLVPGESDEDDGEFLEVIHMDLDELIRKINRGDILDSKTLIGVNAAVKHLENSGD